MRKDKEKVSRLCLGERRKWSTERKGLNSHEVQVTEGHRALNFFLPNKNFGLDPLCYRYPLEGCK